MALLAPYAGSFPATGMSNKGGVEKVLHDGRRVAAYAFVFAGGRIGAPPGNDFASGRKPKPLNAISIRFGAPEPIDGDVTNSGEWVSPAAFILGVALARGITYGAGPHETVVTDGSCSVRMSSSVIVLEFNELCPSIMDRLIAQGDLPNFARLRGQSLEAVTDAAEEPPALEPWVQWVTVHTGLSYAQHGVLDLDDARKSNAPRIWDVVSEAGEKVWICGSMNAVARNDRVNGLFLPDPWASEVEPYPKNDLAPFFRLVKSYVQEHSQARVSLSKLDHARFVAFMAANGLSAKTVAETLSQLLSEFGKNNRWRRTAILDRLQWDLFRAKHRRIRPRFATFFANSTAHQQHYHWREMEPDRFAIQPSQEDLAAYADAIPFGYRKMDELVGEALRLGGPDATLVLCTALSQQPLLRYENDGGKQVFKVKDLAALMKFAGVEGPFEHAPVMAEEFHLHFASEAARVAAAERLAGLRLEDGTAVIASRQQAGARMMAACNLVSPPPADCLVRSAASNEMLRFHDLFAPLLGMKSGCHHPDGILWIRTPGGRHDVLDRKVSLLELAPTFLELCGLAPSPHFPAAAMPEVLERLAAEQGMRKSAVG